MEPVFIDLHIHTSENPDSLDDKFNVALLKKKVTLLCNNSTHLISLTDHNTINTKAYLNAKEVFENVLVGVELHVRHHDKVKAYHCHMYLKTNEITEKELLKINVLLDKLYPKKELGIDDNIPKLEEITTAFDSYDFLLLPHAGQSHSTFDKAVSRENVFDKTLERNIYYNHFDGFTARSDKKMESIQQYFKRLGIHGFTNLITSSDNYSVLKYPEAKDSSAPDFVPTWMLALPTYEGLRLSLSEESRLKYGKKPDVWNEHIKSVHLNNQYTDIDVKLTPGLNVVIGGSSSGKTLFVDSIYRKLNGDFSQSLYRTTKFDVQSIHVDNPTKLIPHYINQNFIMKVCDQNDDYTNLSDIELLKRVFPNDQEQVRTIENGLSRLRELLAELVTAIEGIENIESKLENILPLSRLIITKKIDANPLLDFVPQSKSLKTFSYSKSQYEKDKQLLNQVDMFLEENPLIDHNKNLVVELLNELSLAMSFSSFERKIRDVINNSKKQIDEAKTALDKESAIKTQNFDLLIECIREYARLNQIFYKSLYDISKFAVKIETQKKELKGHELSIENNFELTKNKFLEVINSVLLMPHQIKSFDDITPESLFKYKYKHKDPKVITYEDFKRTINNRFDLLNKKKYKIKSKDGLDYDELSAGFKTSVILDLVLGSKEDIAPLIIDQPEDNLATTYINNGLIQAIKDCKTRKQIILVSHNATIPMLGDAQNVVYCENKSNKLIIQSNPLEGSISGKPVVDIIAEVTDGGKGSIKKRVKKYNLKQFKE